ncbi:MAG: ankyrin repeat domain-containing protein [Candidatus Thiodiazotropha lotti]|nr:ankyrin repeat domain-containing protein [Candidatus Thiodiazotropha lotti]
MKSVTAQISESIRNENRHELLNLFRDNPEQIDSYTYFGSQTWLGYAAQIGKLESIKTLIEIGLNINTGDKRDGRKPVCSAAANSHYRVVEFLLKNGAILDTTLSIQNPLFASIIGRSPRIARLLLEAGIDYTVRYNSQTMKNMDAISFALMRGEDECAKLIASWHSGGNKNQS